MQIRPASREDLGAVRDLLVETWHDTYDGLIGAEKVTEITDAWHSIETLGRQLELPGLTSSRRRAVVGHILADPRRPPTLLISRLYIRPSAQRRGIGRRLIEEATARHPHASELFLEVEAENAKGIGFYRREGFEVVGERVEAGINHLQMRRAGPLT